jgi:hypothetical protein
VPRIAGEGPLGHLWRVQAQSAERMLPALGVTRIAIGIGLLVSPVGLGRGLGIDAGTSRRVAWMARVAGGREIALGIGTLQAWRRGDPADGWVIAQAVSDAVDAVAFTASAARGHVGPLRGYGLAAFAASGAISEVLAARALRRR